MAFLTDYPTPHAAAQGLDTAESIINSTLEVVKMKYVGWDWASQTHDVTVLDEADAVLERWAFAHTEPGGATTIRRLRRHSDPDELR